MHAICSSTGFLATLSLKKRIHFLWSKVVPSERSSQFELVSHGHPLYPNQIDHHGVPFLDMGKFGHFLIRIRRLDQAVFIHDITETC